MAVTVYLYKFNKRVNSPARPSTPDKTLTDVVIKDTCSITSPVLTLDSVALNYNYAYIPDFKRYYWIQRVEVAYNNLYNFYLVVDAMASWQNAIKAKTKYILRSADSSYYNLFIKDDTWVHSEKPSYSVTDVGSIADYPQSGDGEYIISVVNNDSSETINPSSKCYMLHPSQLKTLFTILYDLDNYSNFNWDDLTATYFNPAQYITDVRWYPLAATSISTENSIILDVGWFNTASDLGTGVSVTPVTKYGVTETNTFTLPAASDWTDLSSEWTTYNLYVPGCGMVEIDPIFSGETITCTLYIDFNTGEVFAKGVTSGGSLVYQTNGMLGSDVQMNQVSGNIDFSRLGSNFVTTAATLGLGVASTGGASAVSDTVSSYLTSIGMSMGAAYSGTEYASTLNEMSQQYLNSAINSGKEVASSIKNVITQTVLNPTVASKGSDGARYTIINQHNYLLFKRKFSHLNNDCIAASGALCHKNVKLENLTGYTVVANGNIECQATIEEKNTICQMLQGGFYAEWDSNV